MPKINVYLPDDLAERVKQYDISPSPVCQAALQREVDQAAGRQLDPDDLAAVAARLKESESKHDDERRAEGFEFGQWWARTTAEAHELEEMAELDRQGAGAWDLDLDESTLGNALVEERYAWAGNGGSYRINFYDPYHAGIVEGALEVLTQVEKFNATR